MCGEAAGGGGEDDGIRCEELWVTARVKKQGGRRRENKK